MDRYMSNDPYMLRTVNENWEERIMCVPYKGAADMQCRLQRKSSASHDRSKHGSIASTGGG